VTASLPRMFQLRTTTISQTIEALAVVNGAQHDEHELRPFES
jgi:hypothetical protein